MRVILCDRCGARVERKKGDIGYICISMRDIETGKQTLFTEDIEDWDICDDCMKQIEDFVRMKPAPVPVKHTSPRNESLVKEVNVEVKPEETAKPKATVKTQAKPKITPEQIEQIKTLAVEGHSVNTIAELVGVSAPTVRKYKGEVTASEETGSVEEGSPEN